MNHSVFDLHCDTATELYLRNQPLSRNLLQLDAERLAEYESYIQVFAAFVDKKTLPGSPFRHCTEVLNHLHREIQKNGDSILLITHADDLKRAQKDKLSGAILSIEGGEALEGRISNLQKFYGLGVRLITLTWNWRNELGEGVAEDSGKGLTEFGRQVVLTMERMGMVIDVSHLSEHGFWEVAKLTKRPFVASHSCVRTLCPHPRNLRDAQIQCLIQRKGGIGVNYYPEFLTTKKSCGCDEIVRHIEYILELGGIDAVGLGSDFDGVSVLPCDMQGVQDVKQLISRMKNRNWSETIIKKVLFENFYQILIEIMSGRE